MLEIARIESGRAPITHAKVDVASIVEALIRDLRQKGAPFTVEIEGQHAPVFLDGKRFQLALLSFLRLHLAAAPQAPAKVVITYNAEGASVHVDVDTTRECALMFALGQKDSVYAHPDAALSLILALCARMDVAMNVLPKGEGTWQFSWKIPRAAVTEAQST